MNDSQRGRARVKVVVICLVAVKMNGNSPIKLFRRMYINKLKNIIETPLNNSPPVRILISKNMVYEIFLKTKELKLGLNQNTLGIIRVTRNKLIQLELSSREEEGSNLENKLFIIFICFLVSILKAVGWAKKNSWAIRKNIL